MAGPELSRLLNEFEETVCDGSAPSTKHHDQVPHVQYKQIFLRMLDLW